MSNSSNVLDLVTFGLRDYENCIRYCNEYSVKTFYSHMQDAEFYAREWAYLWVEGEEREAAIELFKELEAEARKIHFVNCYALTKGHRTTVYDNNGPIVSVKQGHWGDTYAIELAMKYGRAWRKYL